MSDSERPELRTFRELEYLVHNLTEELAGFRKRALVAESKLRDIAEAGAPQTAGATERIRELEEENAALRARLDGAIVRTRQVLDRVHFLRQQAQGAER